MIDLVTGACTALAGIKHTIAEAVPARAGWSPGLYAIHGARALWQPLGLDNPDDGPLYVGKAEVSLKARDP